VVFLGYLRGFRGRFLGYVFGEYRLFCWGSQVRADIFLFWRAGWAIPFGRSGGSTAGRVWRRDFVRTGSYDDKYAPWFGSWKLMLLILLGKIRVIASAVALGFC